MGRDRPARRWVILGVGLCSQAAASVYIYGLPLLLPTLRSSLGLSLGAAGLIVGAPALGLLATLVLWGAAADRFGERVVIASGLGLAAGFLLLAAAVRSAIGLGVLLALAGAAGGSVNAASGRMVMGWFSQEERGLAMGIRQTAQPLGVAVAALALPALGHHGLTTALACLSGLCALMVVLVVTLAVDPARPPLADIPARGPTRRDVVLWRTYVSSACLVVPQFAVSAFCLAYLVDERGWAPVDAGRLVFAAQFAGAAGRIASGVWSDRVASRMRPMRQLALASAAVMALLAVGAWSRSWLAVAAFCLGAVVTLADNGLAFTAVAERAGPRTAGRALGTLNTVQNVAAGLTPAFVGVLAETRGYGWGFAAVVAFPLAAAAIIPMHAESTVTLGDLCAESLDTSAGRTPLTS